MDDTLDLRDYLAVLRRRRWLVVLVTIVVTATAVGVSLLQTPVYEATADVLVEPVRRSEDTTLESILLGESAVETERRVITSRPVTERVIEDLGLDVAPDELVDDVSTSIQGDSMVIAVSATNTDAELATAIANSYATSYLEHRRSRAVDELIASQDELNRRSQDLRDQISELDQQIAEANAGATPEDPADTSALESERARLQAQLAQVEASSIDASQPSELVRGGGEVLVPAEVPEGPVSPKPIRTGVLGLVLGLMLGVGLAFLRDHLDDGIRSDEDVRRLVGPSGAPVLGRINHWDDRRADERLMTLVDPHDLVSEEFRALSANVRFSLVNRGRHVAVPSSGTSDFRQQSILVTSANAGEGKSSVAGNLAVAAALAGLRVILVDSDMRQPTLNRRFGIPAGRGVSDLLVDTDLAVGPDGGLQHDHLVEHMSDVGLANLRILPAGTVPPNPTELLASPPMRLLHDRLRSVADLVIYDSPPLLPVADTLELSSYVDAVLLVVRTEVCGRRELGDAIERLEAVGAPVGGFVVNDVASVKGRYGYGYGYGKAYRPREEEPDEPRGRRRRRRAKDEADETTEPAAPASPNVRPVAPPAGESSPTNGAARPTSGLFGSPESAPPEPVADHEVDAGEPTPAPTWVARRDPDTPRDPSRRS